MFAAQHHFSGGFNAGVPLPAPGSGGNAQATIEGLQVLTSLEDVRFATRRAALGAKRLVSIYTPDLEPQLYDEADFLEIIKRFVLGRSFAKARVLTHEPLRLVGHTNRFAVMSRRLSGCIEIRTVAARFAHDRSAFLIADGNAIVFRTRASSWEGVAGFDQPPVARLHLQDFDEMWIASAPAR